MELKKGDKVVMVRYSSRREGEVHDEAFAKQAVRWDSTEIGVVEEMERGLGGPIHKIRCYSRATGRPYPSTYWLEDTPMIAVKYDWSFNEDTKKLE